MVGTEKLSRVLWWLILNAKKKNRPDGALDRNTAQLRQAEDCGRQRTAPGRVAVLTEWHQKGARFLAPDETA